MFTSCSVLVLRALVWALIYSAGIVPTLDIYEKIQYVLLNVSHTRPCHAAMLMPCAILQTRGNETPRACPYVCCEEKEVKKNPARISGCIAFNARYRITALAVRPHAGFGPHRSHEAGS
jgi:hypothetical protein